MDSLFEDLHKSATHFKSTNEHVDRIKQRTAQGGALTEEDVALVKKFANESEEMKDLSKKNNWIQAMADACKGRRFFITSCKHNMGVVPDITLLGDQICIIAGACAPFTIRSTGERYLLVGECYIDGIIGGEVMRDEKELLQTISFE